MSNLAIELLQIKSVDYRYEDGKTVQSTRLPGYSGVSGLDAEQDAEDEKKEAADLEAVPCVTKYLSYNDLPYICTKSFLLTKQHCYTILV